MRFLLIFCLAALAIAGLISIDFSGERERQASALVGQQRTLLVELEAMNDPSVSEFVRDWRYAYPEATAENVEELAIAAAAIKADPSRAKGMTLAAKQKELDALPFESVIGSKPEAKPGL